MVPGDANPVHGPTRNERIRPDCRILCSLPANLPRKTLRFSRGCRARRFSGLGRRHRPRTVCLLAREPLRACGSDRSRAQAIQEIRSASRPENVDFYVAPAENRGLQDHSMDLITAAQSVHWFHLPRFWAEVTRILRPGGIIAVFGDACRMSPQSSTNWSMLYIKLRSSHRAGQRASTL